MEDKVQRFRELAAHIYSTYQKKNADYGDSFSRSIDSYGYVAGLVRMSDKWNRLNALLSPGAERKVEDEKVQDTLLDLASYCIMMAMEVEKREKVLDNPE